MKTLTQYSSFGFSMIQVKKPNPLPNNNHVEWYDIGDSSHEEGEVGVIMKGVRICVHIYIYIHLPIYTHTLNPKTQTADP